MHHPPSPRPARLNSPWFAFLASIAILAVLIGLLAFDPTWWFSRRPPAEPIFVYCAAGLKVPVEAAAREYQARYNIPVHIQYGGSNTLLAQIMVADRGDLFIPADDSYLHTARGKGLLAEVLPLASMKPCLSVPAGNPKGFTSLEDALSRKASFAQANPDAAAVGNLTREVLSSSGHWKPLTDLTVVYKPTVTDVATDVRLGTVDAGIVWDATVKQVPGLEIVPAPSLAKREASLTACVLKRTTQPAATLRFARYLSSRDRGLTHFEQAGFSVRDGDDWEDEPDLKLLAGAMLRPAIEETITSFENREGVKVTRVYNGCGILVAQMKTDKTSPDAYFACDSEFMKQVDDLFSKPIDISTNELVILVKKGNPHGIHTLKDLGKPNLRVGIGHEKQCAMGVLTQETLRQDRSTKQVMRNVVVQTPTGDMLVNQMRTGSLDACIAYISNAAGTEAELEALRIDIPCAIATQPVAVGRDSRHKQLVGRLIDAIRTTESRERFTVYGFKWAEDGKKPRVEK